MNLIEQVEAKIRAMTEILDTLAKEIEAAPAVTLQEKLDRHAALIHVRKTSLALCVHAYVERLQPR